MSSKTSVRKWGLTLPVLMIAGMAWAQTINHSVEITSPAMDKIRFGDMMKFDPRSSGGTSRVMFRATVHNTGSEEALIPAKSAWFWVDYNGTDLPLKMYNKLPVVLKPGEKITMTNVNALKEDGRFSFTVSGDPQVEDIAKVLFNKTDVASINVGAPLPAGAYTFHLKINDVDATATLSLSNPSGFVAINSPGSTFLEEDPLEIYERNPVISWSGDAPEFEVRVVVVDPTVDKTVEDLKNKTPQYKDITRDKVRRYPNSDLQAGKIYAVLLASRVNTMGSSNAEEVWASPTWFTIPVAKTSSEMAANQIIEKLKAIFGDDYASLFEQIKSGKVKGTVMIDGKSVTFQELVAILEKLQSGQANLESMGIK
ncbi:MAG: hypothetical protein L6Q77_06310 [Bacteroidetes bacterium]|nr:hypothetical protein [Bacteroidota bacterium]